MLGQNLRSGVLLSLIVVNTKCVVATSRAKVADPELKSTITRISIDNQAKLEVLLVSCISR